MKVSIIIPAYNAGRTLNQTLQSIQNQKNFNKKNVEIIVVDDGSTDKTIEVAKSFRTKILKQNHGGPAKARNLGVDNAQGEIIIFTDSDCVAEPNWLTNLIEPFKQKEIGAVGGPYSEKDISKNIITRFINTEMGWRYSKIKSNYLQGWGSYNLAVRKEIFKKIGGFNVGFNEHATEDWEFTTRINELGYKIYFQKKSKVQHYHDVSILKYWKKQFYKGKWRMRLYLTKKGRLNKKDEYTGNLVKYQMILVGFFFLSILSLIINVKLIYIPLIMILLLYLTNYELGTFAYKKYSNIIFPLIFMFFQTIRFFSLFFGMLIGIKNILTGKWKN